MSEGGQLGYSLVQTVSSREDLAFKNSSLNEMPLTILIFSESTAIYPKGNTASVTAVIFAFLVLTCFMAFGEPTQKKISPWG